MPGITDVLLRRRARQGPVPGHPHLVRLSSPVALPDGVGTKAGMLHTCAAAGIRVPRGWVVLDEARTGAGTGADPAADPAADVAVALALCFEPGTRLAVRSAFSGEDTAEQSKAGHYGTVLRVPSDDARALADAVREVWASAETAPDASDPDHPLRPMRRDVLVMEMVDAVHAGVAALQEEFEDDLVEAVEGTGDTLVGGTAEDVRRVMLPRLRGWERASRGPDRVPLPFWGMRLSAMLAELRKAVGPGDWDVEWADDGEHAWLLQVRPLTAAVRRRETLAVSNFREILPELPSPFMTSLIAERAPAVFDLYRRFDDGLPSGRPFATVVEGRPFLNMSLLEDMLRRYGLPTGMLVDAMGGRSITNARLRPARVIRHAPTLARMAVTQFLAPGRVEDPAVRLRRASEEAAAAGTATAYVDAAGEAYVTLLTGMVSLATFIGPGMALLRSAGTLAAHAEGHLTETTRMWEDLTRVRDGEIPLEEWLQRHGHRGVYETDLASPRFSESPEMLDALMGAGLPGGGGPPSPHHSLGVRARTVATLPLWEATARAVRAREWLRSEAMRAFRDIRAALLGLADALVAEGALVDRDEIWLLTTSEVRSLDQGWRPDAALLQARRAEQSEHARHVLPDVIPGDHQVVTPPGTEATTVVRHGHHHATLHGLGLTDGDAEGVAWVCDVPSTRLPDGFTPETTILVTRTVDAGWLPTFAVVAGVVVEIGGDLSHGSILLREIGIPSVTNCRGILAEVETGDRLRVRAHRGQVVIRP